MNTLNRARRWACAILLSGLGTAGAAEGPARADCDGPAHATVLAPAAPMDAGAVWLDRRTIRWPGTGETGSRYWLVHSPRAAVQAVAGAQLSGAGERIELRLDDTPLAPELVRRFAYVAAGRQLQVPAADLDRMPALLRQQQVLVETDAGGERVRRATALQVAAALDDWYAGAATGARLGALAGPRGTRFDLWAPTAVSVALCLHRGRSGASSDVWPLQRDDRSGVWSAQLPQDLRGVTYTYLVDVFVRGTGLVRNRVTDPYSLSLNTDSRRSWIGRLDDPRLAPAGWLSGARPAALKGGTDLVVYELHVRDFSASDASVRPAYRGKYLAFTERSSQGMRHLRALAQAGITDLHLLPVFDLASVPERGCSTVDPALVARAAPDSEEQQARVMQDAAGDCFNWGYDPYHFGAPEGSYASDADDGAVRIREFRRMVQALHRAGLRVGMDLVYNHTTASGQKERSVLDRIVPGYYHRLDATGRVETSTCCDNTATEHRMMAQLMIDTAVMWVRDYQIDSFRFDLMGHQPREAMLRLQKAVDAAAGRHIPLIGEGWNFGEVAGGARFVQASQASLGGSGIASFNDRLRDAVRGGGCCDNAEQTLTRQGWINGQFHDPRPGSHATREDLLRTADLVRVGLAGTLAGYRMQRFDGRETALSEIDYGGQPAGFAQEPGEVVNYVENHDNPTLFDIDVLKLPPGTSREDRARVQVLGLALTAFSQGVAYFHAGVEALRSKSGDRNSYDSGDWFNRLDWSFTDNHWGSGLPPKGENLALWPALKPLLADPAIKPGPAEIRFTRDAFLDLLRIRSSTRLLRLPSANEVAQRLTLLNVGPGQVPTVMVGHLQGRGLPDAGFDELVYLVNAQAQAVTLELPGLRGRPWVLHPVHRAPGAADPRPARESRWDDATATLHVPARTAMVYVVERTRPWEGALSAPRPASRQP